jgi:hypothetical protein
MTNPKDIVIVTRFKTPDGVEHSTLTEALNHTSTPVSTSTPMPYIEPDSYRMWEKNCEKRLVETDRIGTCLIVYLPNQSGVRAFLRDSKKYGYITEGIDIPGWYQWDECLFAYVPIPMEYLPLISN